ncbi:MAG: hypothetical protein V1760_03405, partial [Candidatus Peregrinibacteria bacterium]
MGQVRNDLGPAQNASVGGKSGVFVGYKSRGPLTIVLDDKIDVYWIMRSRPNPRFAIGIRITPSGQVEVGEFSPELEEGFKIVREEPKRGLLLGLAKNAIAQINQWGNTVIREQLTALLGN